MLSVLSSILYKSLMIPSSKNICSQKVMHDGIEFTFCQRQKVLNQYQVKNELILSQQSNSIFVYTEAVKESNINVKLGRTNVFAVFGFELDNQEISSSTINVTIDFSIVTGALVCLQCNLSVDSSTLVFTASGQKLSGIMTTAGLFFQVSKSLLQFRLNGLYQSGLVNSIQREMAAFALQDSRMTCYFYNDGDQTGNLVAEVGAKTVLLASGFSICSNGIKDVASASDPAFWAVSGSIGQNCLTICESGFVTYGLCLMDLLNGVQINGQASCQNNFEFDGKDCVCEAGYVLNGTVCLNLVGYLTDTTISIDKVNNSLQYNDSLSNQLLNDANMQIDQKLQKFTIELQVAINQSQLDSIQQQTFVQDKLLKEIQTNISNTNMSLQNNLQILSKTLNDTINISQPKVNSQFKTLQNDISSSYISSESNLLKNTTSLNSTLSTTKIRINNQTEALDNKLNKYIKDQNDTNQISIEEFKCNIGDCERKYFIVIEGGLKYCSSTDAKTMCEQEFTDFSVTKVQTCKTFSSGDKIKAAVYCCKPRGYWTIKNGVGTCKVLE
ncbi:Growth_factor receptor cysteine-rich domain superfamily [Hexamita inflata]|uniref:Growth factor receptor cysteine-rich domain superfamily n=1 Tax=Hexamita inflata TaxID=28002 RepID=A0AA86V5S2_9EUKA|nr:Growth factor receptor cysteine-rich domain superfamily [Hexamita inflata]